MNSRSGCLNMMQHLRVCFDVQTLVFVLWLVYICWDQKPAVVCGLLLQRRLCCVIYYFILPTSMNLSRQNLHLCENKFLIQVVCSKSERNRPPWVHKKVLNLSLQHLKNGNNKIKSNNKSHKITELKQEHWETLQQLYITHNMYSCVFCSSAEICNLLSHNTLIHS